MGGLQDCFHANPPRFYREHRVSYQIINTDLTPGRGEHWILFKLNPDDGTVSVYDSAQSFTNCHLKYEVLRAMNHMLGGRQMKMTVKFMKCPQQTGTGDCGVHAIANLTSLLCKEDPAVLKYGSSQSLRQHLASCLETCHLESFPSSPLRGKKGDPVIQSEIYDLHCECRLIDDGRLYFECG